MFPIPCFDNDYSYYCYYLYYFIDVVCILIDLTLKVPSAGKSRPFTQLLYTIVGLDLSIRGVAS